MDLASAIEWAEKSGKFPGPQLGKFRIFLDVLQPVCVPPGCLSSGIKIDEGTFGSIERAAFKPPGKVGTPVCVRQAGYNGEMYVFTNVFAYTYIYIFIYIYLHIYYICINISVLVCLCVQ